jgi:hypothetical protein
MQGTSKWQTSSILKELLNRETQLAADLIAFLQRDEVMKSIQLILDKSGSTPLDFTLHDADHSYRVAERIWDLIPAETKSHLSEYELVFLLLSAYLHDIGMSPEVDIVSRHLNYITSQNKECLRDSEVQELQNWLDSRTSIPIIDIRLEIVTNSELSKRIITYYVRHKHNDWSGDWINKHLKNIRLGNYVNWASDLILLCKSHHFSINELLTSNFDSKLIGDSVVNIRYLSMCLRVADVMENDPERTPDILLRHRRVADSSIRYWLKDHLFSIKKIENGFAVYSRPINAIIHKAVLETVGYIEDELKLCQLLAMEKPLTKSSFGSFDYYQWKVDASLTIDIKPDSERYEFIHGAFRPNTQKILELLGGSQLYGDPIWAVRELLQNAFDAIKERIAFDLVNSGNYSKEYIQNLSKVYKVSLSLVYQEDKNEYWLICKDTGVGMTKSIIENFFLESGSSRRTEVTELKRDLKRNGINLGRTAEFGIGALSYFMIAESFELTTKRVQNSSYNDKDLIGWNFSLYGTHDFGELSKVYEPINGTEIRLKLRDIICENIVEWSEKVYQFVEDNLLVAPCTFTFSSVLSTEVEQKIQPGWTKNEEYYNKELKQLIVERNESNKRGYLPGRLPALDELRSRSDINEAYGEFANEIIATTDFLRFEGRLPDGLGTYRMIMPFFKLNHGNSLCYLKENSFGDEILISSNAVGYSFYPVIEKIEFSLKGIRILPKIIDTTFDMKMLPNVFISVDLEDIDLSTLAVNRHSIDLGDDYDRICFFLEKEYKEILRASFREFDNRYLTLYGLPDIIETDLYWFKFNYPIGTAVHIPGEKDLHNLQVLWSRIEFPIVYADYKQGIIFNARYRGGGLTILPIPPTTNLKKIICRISLNLREIFAL